MAKQGLVLAAAAFAAVLLWPRKSEAAIVEDGNGNYYPPEDYPPDDSFDYWPVIEPVAPISMNEFSPNLRAFLYLIQRAEHNAYDVESNEAYRTVFGGDGFTDYSNHPAITGEWKGKKLSDSMCRNAGFRPGCVSTAAGAYQIIKPTWERVKKAGSWGPALPDFGPASQDEAARRLLIECGALGLIERGSIVEAVAKAAPVWASLPGNTAKQSQRSIDEVLAFYDFGLKG